MRVRLGGPLVLAVALCREVGRDVTDLSLAGDAVVWGELSPYRLGRRLTWTARLGRAGQATRIRFRSRTPPTTLGVELPRVAASATHLALMPFSIGEDGSGRFRLLAGPLEGTLTTLNGSILSAPALLDWSGSVLVATEGDRRRPVFTARDAAAGFVARELPLAPGTRDVRAAGSFVASSSTVSHEGETEDELDARIDVGGLDGKPTYSVTAEDSFIEDFALQDDGKVAWLQRRNVEPEPGALAWASPAEPWAHVVARDVPTGGIPIGLGRDRILFGRRVRPRLDSWQPWVADLAGVARPTWFALAAPFGRIRADFDGERLAVAAGGCVWVGDVDRALKGPPAAGAPRRSPAKDGDRCDARAAATPTPSRA